MKDPIFHFLFPIVLTTAKPITIINMVIHTASKKIPFAIDGFRNAATIKPVKPSMPVIAVTPDIILETFFIFCSTLFI